MEGSFQSDPGPGAGLQPAPGSGLAGAGGWDTPQASPSHVSSWCHPPPLSPRPRCPHLQGPQPPAPQEAAPSVQGPSWSPSEFQQVDPRATFSAEPTQDSAARQSALTQCPRSLLPLCLTQGTVRPAGLPTRPPQPSEPPRKWGSSCRVFRMDPMPNPSQSWHLPTIPGPRRQADVHGHPRPWTPERAREFPSQANRGRPPTCLPRAHTPLAVPAVASPGWCRQGGAVPTAGTSPQEHRWLSLGGQLRHGGLGQGCSGLGGPPQGWGARAGQCQPPRRSYTPAHPQRGSLLTRHTRPPTDSGPGSAQPRQVPQNPGAAQCSASAFRSGLFLRRSSSGCAAPPRTVRPRSGPACPGAPPSGLQAVPGACQLPAPSSHPGKGSLRPVHPRCLPQRDEGGPRPAPIYRPAGLVDSSCFLLSWPHGQVRACARPRENRCLTRRLASPVQVPDEGQNLNYPATCGESAKA